jgi:hypothetical protein
MRKFITLFAVLGLVLALAPAAQAGPGDIIPLTGAASTAGDEDFWEAIRVTDDSYMVSGEGAWGVMDGSKHGGWYGSDETTWFRVDLGQSYDVGTMYVWNGQPGPGVWDRGVGSADIYYSTDATAPGANFSDPKWTLITSGQLFNMKPANTANYGPTDAFALNVTARVIGLEVTQGFGGNSGNSFAQLQFSEAISGPTIEIADNSVDENQAIGAAAGSLSVANTNGTFNYSLVETGSFPGNDSFTLSGGNNSNVLTAAVFDYEAQTSYDIRVLATETNPVTGFSLTNTLTIAVSDVIDTTPGDGYTGPYRLAFVTSTTAQPTNSAISWYNAFVTTAADAVPELLALGATWKCLGSTVGTSAKVNTSTDSTGDANDVPIYTTTGLLIATNNADLWDGTIANIICFDNGTVILPYPGSGEQQAWTGTNTDGTSADAGGIPGDGNPLGSGPTPNNIRLVRGGYTDGRWISGPTDNDASAKYYLALSGVIGGAPVAPGTVLIIK